MSLDQRPLQDGDLEQFWELEREAFHVAPADHDRWQRWERAIGLERVEGVFLDGRLVATCGVLGMGQWFGGRSVPMGGVRAVATRVEHRGRGFATRAVAAGLAAMCARGEAVSVLYPQVVRSYRALGWEIAGTLLFRQVPPRALAALGRPGVPVRRATEADRPIVRACYARVASETNGFVDREHGRWPWLFDRLADEHWLVAGDDGYVVYRHVDPPPAGPEGFRIFVLDLLATTPAALRALWATLGDASSVVPTIYFRCGPTDPLPALLDGLDVTITRERHWMLRLVDAPAAVQARGFPPGVHAQVPLEIGDDVCPSNAGRWTLVVADGRGHLERGGTGSVQLGIGALSALYSGWATTGLLARSGRLAGGSDAERVALDCVFAGPLPWMLDEF
jgi:predicted acetyltransferase